HPDPAGQRDRLAGVRVLGVRPLEGVRVERRAGRDGAPGRRTRAVAGAVVQGDARVGEHVAAGGRLHGDRAQHFVGGGDRFGQVAAVDVGLDVVVAVVVVVVFVVAVDVDDDVGGAERVEHGELAVGV